MKTTHFALVCLFPAIFIILGRIPVSPQDARPASIFPDSYLEGVAEFDLAIDLQGDLRGNFGPCG